jgi:nucleoid-associated protein YgaU
VTEAPAIEGPVTEALAASGRETEAPASDAAGAGGGALGGPAPDAPPGDAAAPEVLADLPAVAEPAAPETSPAPPAAPAPVQSQPAPAVIVASGDGVRLVQAPVGDAPPEVLQNVVIDTISYSPGGDVVLAGRGSGDRVVRLYLDNQPLGDVAIAADGNWRADFPDIDTGVYTLRADEIDGEGRVVSRFETPFQREAREVVAGTAPLRGARAEVVTVQPGFTLWGISRETYGAGILYVQVFEANRDQIRDPDLIYPGQIFRLPEIAPAQP